MASERLRLAVHQPADANQVTGQTIRSLESELLILGATSTQVALHNPRIKTEVKEFVGLLASGLREANIVKAARNAYCRAGA